MKPAGLSKPYKPANCVKRGRQLLLALFAAALAACSSIPPAPRGTGELAVVVERATGSVQILDQRSRTLLARVDGLGDLSHAHVTYSADARYAYVFGRDGGLSKVDLLLGRLEKRTLQAGNSIGGSISQDGELIVAQNYQPGGIKVFAADTLELLSEVSTLDPATGQASKVVGLADLPGNRFAFALFEAGEIWLVDLSSPRLPKVERFRNVGKQPYDGLASQDGRYFLAGLYGEDGLALLDTWQPQAGVKHILAGYGRGEEKLPVFKMPHLRGWSLSGDLAFFPAIGRHEVLIADRQQWQEVGRVPVYGQPVFVMARPDGRQVWVNFAFPHNDTVQVIDVPSRQIIATLKPGRAILHMEFSGRGHEVWLSSRDDNQISIYDTQTLQQKAQLPAQSPSGIFFSWRAQRSGM